MCIPTPTPAFWFRLWPDPNPLAWGAVLGLILLAISAATLASSRFDRRYHALAATKIYSRTRSQLITAIALGIAVVGVGLIALQEQHLIASWADGNLARLASAHCSVLGVAQRQMQLNQTLDLWFGLVSILTILVIGLGIVSGIGRNKLSEILRETSQFE